MCISSMPRKFRNFRAQTRHEAVSVGVDHKMGSEVTAENAWTEYPRPQLMRDNWQNLNGHWDYAITPVEQQATADGMGGQDSRAVLPGIETRRRAALARRRAEALWYRRTFDASTIQQASARLLNFEAVDYRCEVFVNGQIGRHASRRQHAVFLRHHRRGSQDGENELVVRVEDETEELATARQASAQRSRHLVHAGLGYLADGVAGTGSAKLHRRPEDRHRCRRPERSRCDPIVQAVGSRANVRMVVKDGDDSRCRRRRDRRGDRHLRSRTRNCGRPLSPHLYDLEVTLLDADGKDVDRVKSYAGIRTVGKAKDDDGHWRFTLNGEPIFHWGPLDQGWWPDGLLTPPSDEAMLFDIEWLKAAGFNMIRKHIKVEPRRYYYHCDRLGMMVWQDQVSGGHEPALDAAATQPGRCRVAGRSNTSSSCSNWNA